MSSVGLQGSLLIVGPQRGLMEAHLFCFHDHHGSRESNLVSLTLALKSFHAYVTPVPFTHFTLTEASHMAVCDLRAMGDAVLLCACKERRAGMSVNSPNMGAQGCAFSTFLDNSKLLSKVIVLIYSSGLSVQKFPW